MEHKNKQFGFKTSEMGEILWNELATELKNAEFENF